MSINSIVLAAGKGTRMKSKTPKVLHQVLKKPMIMHVIDNLKSSGVTNIISVVGHQADLVEKVIGNQSSIIEQKEQLGTGHAVLMCIDQLKILSGATIIICGDTPLITSETISQLIAHHNSNNNDATILTGVLEDPKAYGRIIRDCENNVTGIVEMKDASSNQLSIKEFNTGTYIVNNDKLVKYLPLIDNNNSAKEYYLTDLISLMSKDNLKIDGFVLDDLDQTLGINDRVALELANRLLKESINKKHMLNGVTITDSASTYIGIDVTIGQDTIILPNTMILGKATVGEDCIIGPNTELVNSTVHNNSTILFSHVTNSYIKSNVKIGPYARLRQDCIIEEDVNIGNFVEFKNVQFGKNSKSAHLTYLGDASIGNNVNIGCGTITVNYDGINKFRTTIEDSVFVGCNSNLIAPVTLKKDSYVAAGSTITVDVPEKSLVVARSRERIIENYRRKNKIGG